MFEQLLVPGQGRSLTLPWKDLMGQKFRPSFVSLSTRLQSPHLKPQSRVHPAFAWTSEDWLFFRFPKLIGEGLNSSGHLTLKASFLYVATASLPFRGRVWLNLDPRFPMYEAIYLSMFDCLMFSLMHSSIFHAHVYIYDVIFLSSFFHRVKL